MKKKVGELKVGEFVRPEKNWEAYSASIEAGPIRLDLKPNYRVSRRLEGVWLSLDPPEGFGYATTIIYVHFVDPDRIVEVVE